MKKVYQFSYEATKVAQILFQRTSQYLREDGIGPEFNKSFFKPKRMVKKQWKSTGMLSQAKHFTFQFISTPLYVIVESE